MRQPSFAEILRNIRSPSSENRLFSKENDLEPRHLSYIMSLVKPLTPPIRRGNALKTYGVKPAKPKSLPTVQYCWDDLPTTAQLARKGLQGLDGHCLKSDTFTKAELKKVFRTLARRFHPDTCKDLNGRSQFEASCEYFAIIHRALKERDLASKI